MLNGQGKLYRDNGQLQCEGKFKNDMLKRGKYFYNEKIFEGEFKDNMLNGQGIIYNEKGEILKKGIFVDDNFTGFGISENKYGICEYGRFENDILIDGWTLIIFDNKFIWSNINKSDRLPYITLSYKSIFDHFLDEINLKNEEDKRKKIIADSLKELQEE